MMFLEGIPSILLGIVCLIVLRDSPSQVRWLTPPEQEWLAQELAREKAAKPIETSALKVLINPRVIPYALAYFCIVVAVIGMTLWMPQIIRSLGVETSMQIGLLSALPWVIGLIIQFCLSTHSDPHGGAQVAYRHGDGLLRRGLRRQCDDREFDCRLCRHRFPRWVDCSRRGRCSGRCRQPCSVAWAAASAIAFINSTAMVGGFLGPFLIGWIREATGSYTIALISMAVVLVVGAGIVLTRKAGRDFVARAPSEASI